MPYSFVEVYQHSGGMYHLKLQEWRLSQPKNQHIRHDNSNEYTYLMYFISFLPVDMNYVPFILNYHTLGACWNWLIFALDIGYQNLQQNNKFNFDIKNNEHRTVSLI
jgi:hypothetical protein